MLLSTDRLTTDDESLPPSLAVIVAVAEKEGIDPLDLEPPTYDALYDVINPEALDSLFDARTDGTARSQGSVEFSFCGYSVVVTHDGAVEVTPIPES